MIEPIIINIFKKIKVENVPNAKIQHHNIQRADKEEEENIANKIEDAKKVDNDEAKEALERIINVAKFFNRKIRVEIEKELNIMVAKII